MHGNMVQSARVVKCAESKCNHADFQRDRAPFASIRPAQGALSPVGGEKNHCSQIGLASQEQRWGIEGASVE